MYINVFLFYINVNKVMGECNIKNKIKVYTYYVK